MYQNDGRMICIHGKVDNGPEFISRTLDAWTYDQKTQLVFSRPCTPTDNAHIESFNGSLREECLNTNWFMSLDDAKEKLERRRNDHKEYRPHSALTYLSPTEFARNYATYEHLRTLDFLIETEPLWGVPK